MDDVTQFLLHTVDNLLNRPSGPFAIRFIAQPLMAAALAIRDGIVDARNLRPPYLWTILTDAALRKAWLLEGIVATSRPLMLAFAIDTVYQLVELRGFHPGEAAIIATALAFVPYLIVRGPAARLYRRIASRRAHQSQKTGL